jgi:hypothetical protein
MKRFTMLIVQLQQIGIGAKGTQQFLWNELLLLLLVGQ